MRDNGGREPPPLVHIWDLARLVEGIVLHDELLTTEPVKAKLEKFRQEPTGRFDMQREEYSKLLGEIITEIPHAAHEEASRRLSILDNTRRRFRDGERATFYASDILALPEILPKIEFGTLADAWAVNLYEDPERRLLYSMHRVRTLLTVASVVNVPYEPSVFRLPLVEALYPGNATVDQLGPYRQFEQNLYTYLAEVVGAAPAFQLPLIFNMVLREARRASPDDVFKLAIQYREDAAFVTLRRLFGSFVGALGDIDVGAMAKTRRALEDELAKIKRRFEGKDGSRLEFKVKLGWMPFELKYDLKELLARLRNYGVHRGLARFSRLTQQTFSPLYDARREIDRVLGVKLAPDALNALSAG